MEKTYNNLCQFNFGKHCYVVMKNADKVIYFQSVDGKYVMSITNFNLYDNQGKSLTLVNQHFFMNQLVNRLNIAFKKGFFSSDQDLIDYLNDLKKNSECSIDLRKLFKGSFMSSIDEVNFERNKREILKFLDKYRFDTFINYNNVSIFDGSLDKNSVDFQVTDENLKSDIENGVSIQNFDFTGEDFSIMDNSLEEGNKEDQQSSVESVVENSDSAFDGPTEVLEQSGDSQSVGEINTVDQVMIYDPIVQRQSVAEDLKAQNDFGVNSDSNSDMFSFDTVIDETNNFVDSNDYFSSLDDVSPDDVFQESVVAGGSSDDYLSQVDDFQSHVSSDLEQSGNNLYENGDSNISNDFNYESRSNLSYVDEVRRRLNSSNELNQSSLDDNYQNNAGVLEEQQAIKPVIEQSLAQSVIDNSLSDNVSSLNVVKNKNVYNSEVESTNASFESDNSVDTVIDNGNKNGFEQIPDVSLEVSKNEVSDEKGKIGIVIFMILLVFVLGLLAFYLYNYVF